MKKNTVITIVIAALLCIVFLAINPITTIASGQLVLSSDTERGFDKPHLVTFSSQDYRKTLSIEDGASFGDSLPAFPEVEAGKEWNWVIDGTDTYLTADTPVTENMSVTAVMRVKNLDKDFMTQKSGILVAAAGNNDKKIGGLIAAAKDSISLIACLVGTTDCAPSAWTFEFSGECIESNRCYYYITSGGSYLKIDNDGVYVQAEREKTLVKKINNNRFYVTSDSGTSYLNFKYNSDTNRFFKASGSDNIGSQLYFYDGGGDLVTVNFDVDPKATLPAPVSLTVPNGNPVTLPSYDGTLNGHEFIGWSDQNGTLVTSPYFPEDEETALTAVFDSKFILWFDPLNGLDAIPYEDLTGTKYPDYKRQGYRLKGWSETPLADDAEYEVGVPILLELTAHKTLYAVWQKISVVTFARKAYAPISFTIDLPDTIDLSHEYPIAEKWRYVNDANTEVIIDVKETPMFEVPDYDITFFEVCEPETEFTVQFNGNGGTPANFQITGKKGDFINLFDYSVEREGYEFLGWKDAFGSFYDKEGQFEIRIDETLTAVWGYTISFDLRGGDGKVDSINCVLGDDSATFPVYHGKRVNNKFIGWIASPTFNAGDKIYRRGDSFLDENGLVRTTTYYALYEVTLYLDKNGGGNVTPVDRIERLQPWQEIDLQNYRSQTGNKDFFGWSAKQDDKEQPNVMYQLNGELEQTAYAIWGSTVTFTKFGQVTPIDTKTGITGTSYQTLVLPAENGRNFKGWTDGTNEYNSGMSYDFPDNHLTLYAVWDGKVTVNFSVNGGSEDDTLPPYYEVQLGNCFTFPEYHNPTKSGQETVYNADGSRTSKKVTYKFVGWSDSSNMKDGYYHVIYEPSGNYCVSLDSGSTMTFYAVWDLQEGETKDNVKFGIRLDGTIPFEPSTYKDAKYSTSIGIKQGNVRQYGVVTDRHWVTDNDPDPSKLNPGSNPEDRYYIVNDVTEAVGGNVPSAAEISDIMSHFTGFYPDHQYVLWYVLKWQGTGSGENLWHVDGVILNKNLATLVYDANFEGQASWIQTGFQELKFTDVIAGADGSKDNFKDSYIPVRGDNWRFTGWNTMPDGTGTPIANGQTINLDKDVVRLYAQWKEEVQTVSLKKEWKDHNNELSVRPSYLNVELKLSNEKTYYRTLTPDASGGLEPWSVSLQIPKYDTHGTPIGWTWKETEPAGYQKVDPVPDPADPMKSIITNKLVTKATVTKVWDDENDNDGKRPGSVTVQLYKYTDNENSKTAVDGYGSVTLTGDENWTYETKLVLPVFDENGNKITYIWDEVETDVPVGYEKTDVKLEGDPVNGWSTRITNRHVSETAPLKVVMNWDDIGAETPRPNSVTLTLTGTIPGTGDSGKVIVHGPETITVNAPDSGGSGYQWDEYTTGPLKVYSSGQEITYTWSEIIPDKYDHNAELDVVTDLDDNARTKITNHRYVVTVTADNKDKVYGNIDPALTASVNKAQMKNGDDVSTIKYNTPTRETGEDVIRKLNPDGKTYTEPESRTITVTGDSEQGYYHVEYEEGEFTIKPAELTVTADPKAKVYGDKDPSFTKQVTGMKNGDLQSQLVDPIVTVTRSGSDENVGTYQEVIIPSGPAAIQNYNINFVNGNFTITPATVTVKAQDKYKTFGDPDPVLTASAAITQQLTEEERQAGKQCPDGVCIVRDLGQASCSNGVCTVTDGKDTIRFTLTRDPGEDVKADGYEITAAGDAVQGNYSVIYIPGTLTITDKPNALSVTKVWKDNNNHDGFRPGSLLVTLTGSDGSSRSVSLSEANNWSASISDLPQTVNGNPVTYSWSEEPVREYSSEVEVNGDVTTFTNTHQIARTSRSVSKVWDDRDNAAGTRPSSLLVTLRNGSTTVFSTRLNEENGWHAVVSNLPVFENGSPITYTWYEQAVGGGYRAVSSTTSGGNTTLVNSNLYTVTIHYRYADGTRVFDSYTDRLPVGASFSVASPALRGYTPSQASVTGTMPARDVEFIVIYTPEGQPVVTPTPVPTVHPEEPHKDVPHPRDLDPDADHPLVVPMPNMLVEIDDLNTALGLGEVVSSNHGFALE